MKQDDHIPGASPGHDLMVWPQTDITMTGNEANESQEMPLPPPCPTRLYRIRTIRGFTLLELLVVLVIIGLLAGIVGPTLFKNVGKSEITTAKAQIDSLSKAVDTFRLDNGRFPSNEEGLSALTTRPANTPNWNGPYLKKNVPLDPWGQPYHYHTPGEHSPDYDLYSYGPDKTAGGDGENADLGNW